MSIRVGDKVKVKNWGKSYSNTVSWFEESTDIPRGLIARYAYGDDSNFHNCQYSDTETYTVKYLKDNKALITAQGRDYSPVYMIGIEGLELKDVKKMTVSEIEEELGYRVEIIAENEE